MKHKMTFLLLVAFIAIFMFSITAYAEPLNYEEIIIDENTPYSTVLNMINEENTDSSGIVPIEEPVVEQELGEDAEMYLKAISDNMEYMVEMGKVLLCVVIAAVVIILIALFSLRWFH